MNLLQALLMASFFSFFSSCKPDRSRIDNRYLSADMPAGYAAERLEPDDILYISKTTDGLQSIFSIDHIPDNHLLPNSATIQHFSPAELLADRLKSIEEQTQETGSAWTAFSTVTPPRPISFQGLQGAEAVFAVEEDVGGRTIQRKIKRWVLFTRNDLWNVIMAPTDAARYDEEMKVFDDLLTGMKLKF